MSEKARSKIVKITFPEKLTFKTGPLQSLFHDTPGFGFEIQMEGSVPFVWVQRYEGSGEDRRLVEEVGTALTNCIVSREPVQRKPEAKAEGRAGDGK